MSKKTRHPGLILILVAGVAACGIFVAGTMWSTVNIDIANFNPLQIRNVGFDVRNSGGNVIQSISASSGVGHFSDPTHVYPNVDIFYSQPYLSDAVGTAIGNTTNALAPVARLIIGGDVYFMHEIYYTVNYGARTYTNFKTLTDTLSYLDPMVGLSVRGLFTLAVGAPADQPMPSGCLAAIIDTGFAPWRCAWTSGARITSSLEQIDFAVGGSPVRPGYGYGDALGKLQTQWGNSPVIVQPKIDLAALSNYITLRYTTTGTLSNGTTATITTTQHSALIGFANAVRTDDSNIKGLIPNTFAVNPVNMPSNQPTGASNRPIDRDQTATTSRTTISGSVQYIGESPAMTITGIAEPHGITTNLSGVVPHLDLTRDVINSFSLVILVLSRVVL